MRSRIVFMGTPEFAVPSLSACVELGEVVAVVTQPDRPRGRGQELSPSPVKRLAVELGLPVLQPDKVRTPEFATQLSSLKPDVCVVTAYGRILPPAVLAIPRLGCVNVHASLLPRFRGAAPIAWAIASGDAKTGVCLMAMDEGMDTGPVLARAELAIAPDETGQTLHDRLAALGRRLLLDELPRFLRGALRPVPQTTQGVVLAPMLTREDGRIDFRRPAAELERRIRAFNPWPGAYTQFGGRGLKVLTALLRSGSGEPGVVLKADAGGIEVACGAGSLLITQLLPEGRRAMSAQEFLVGRRIAAGERPFG